MGMELLACWGILEITWINLKSCDHFQIKQLECLPTFDWIKSDSTLDFRMNLIERFLERIIKTFMRDLKTEYAGAYFQFSDNCK